MTTCNLLTCQEAATIKNVHVAVLQQWIRTGKLRLAAPFPQPESGLPVRVPRGGKGHAIACICPEHLAAYACVPRSKGSLRRENAALHEEGLKRCSGCSLIQPVADYPPCPSGQFGLHSRCRNCERSAARKFAQANRDKRIAYKKAYRAANREKVKAYKREYSKRMTREKNAPWKHMRRYHSLYHAANKVLSEGKTSPMCRLHGFAVVRDPAGAFRAARLDQRLALGEHAIAHFSFNTGLGQWIILRPPLGVKMSTEDERVLRLYQGRESRDRSKKGRKPLNQAKVKRAAVAATAASKTMGGGVA